MIPFSNSFMNLLKCLIVTRFTLFSRKTVKNSWPGAHTLVDQHTPITFEYNKHCRQCCVHPSQASDFVPETRRARHEWPKLSRCESLRKLIRPFFPQPSRKHFVVYQDSVAENFTMPALQELPSSRMPELAEGTIFELEGNGACPVARDQSLLMESMGESLPTRYEHSQRFIHRALDERMNRSYASSSTSAHQAMQNGGRRLSVPSMTDESKTFSTSPTSPLTPNGPRMEAYQDFNPFDRMVPPNDIVYSRPNQAWTINSGYGPRQDGPSNRVCPSPSIASPTKTHATKPNPVYGTGAWTARQQAHFHPSPSAAALYSQLSPVGPSSFQLSPSTPYDYFNMSPTDSPFRPDRHGGSQQGSQHDAVGSLFDVHGNSILPHGYSELAATKSNNSMNLVEDAFTRESFYGTKKIRQQADVYHADDCIAPPAYTVLVTDQKQQYSAMKCPFCGQTISGRYKKGNLRRHIKSMHESSEPISCKYCTKTYRRSDALYKHVQKKHRELSLLEAIRMHQQQQTAAILSTQMSH